MFLKFKSALFIIAIMTCALTSCVEDERNPFENSGYGQGESFDVKLPGEGTFYVGSEIELRGSGFTSGDEIYVSDYINSSELVEARVVRYTSDKLFFIMPDSVLEYGNGDVEVLLRRNTVSHRLGTLYVNSIYCYNQSLYDEYCDVVIFDAYDFVIGDNDRVYYQEMDDYGTLLGEPIEAELEYIEEFSNALCAKVYPVLSRYIVTYVRNGEITMSQEMYKSSYMDEWYDANLGESIRIEWRGFRNGDKILLSYSGIEGTVATIDNPRIDDNGLTFDVPSELDLGAMYEILLQRYDGYATVIGHLNINN